MNRIRQLAMWVVWNVPIGPAAPYVMGFALNANFKRDCPGLNSLMCCKRPKTDHDATEKGHGHGD